VSFAIKGFALLPILGCSPRSPCLRGENWFSDHGDHVRSRRSPDL